MVDDGKRVYSIDNNPVQFTCLFWQNCKNNACVISSEGFTCERCNGSHDYYRSSAVCAKCLDVPVSLIIAVLFILLTLYGLIRKGISVSQLTQLKILINFVQLLILTLWIKVDWSYDEDSSLAVYVLDALNVVNLNVEIFHFECFFSLQDVIYYLKWFSSIVIPFFCITIGALIDYMLHKKIEATSDNGGVIRTRQQLRRLMIFLLLLWYAPATQLSLRSYICESNIPLSNRTNDSDDGSNYRYDDVNNSSDCRDRWLYNGNICCTDPVMQVITVLSTAVLALYSVGFPAGLFFFTARAIKFKNLHKYQNFYGGLYESFREKWSFMEAMIMLRKFVLIISTDVLPINPIYLACFNFVLSLVYLLVVIFGRPYGGWQLNLQLCSYGIYNFLEIISTEVVCIVQIMAVLMAFDISDNAMDYTIVTLIALFLFIWLIFYLFNVTWKDDDDDLIESHVEELSLQDSNHGEISSSRGCGCKKLFRSNKIIDAPIKSEEVERRQHAFEDL